MEGLRIQTEGHQERPMSRFETPEFKEAVRGIERQRGIGATDKILILATALGLKRASIISYRGDKGNINNVQEKLSALGLLSHANESREIVEGKYKKVTVTDLVIALESSRISDAIAGSAKDNTGRRAQDFTNFGNAMGYPETAVKAFNLAEKEGNEHELLTGWELEEALTEEEEKFLFFSLSRDNHVKELEWLHGIIDAIKEHSPAIYRERMRESYI